MGASDHIVDTFSGRTRVRVCGVAITSDQILLINHKGLNLQDEWWAPPGGGVEFGESLQDALVREFKEETGLEITVKTLLFVSEHIEDSLHAVEVFFEVDVVGGDLVVGLDPELPPNKQSIFHVRYVTFEELRLIPNALKHQSLRDITNVNQVLSKKGYLHN